MEFWCSRFDVDQGAAAFSSATDWSPGSVDIDPAGEFAERLDRVSSSKLIVSTPVTSTRENGPAGAFDIVVLIGGCLCLIGYATWPVETGCAPGAYHLVRTLHP